MWNENTLDRFSFYQLPTPSINLKNFLALFKKIVATPPPLPDNYPLITATGLIRATFFAIPARCTTSTTASTSL